MEQFVSWEKCPLFDGVTDFRTLTQLKDNFIFQKFRDETKVSDLQI